MVLEGSEIRSFFKNQTVFLTGGSGFLGKLLIEKLLRECKDVRKIYVLMRPKKGKSPEERFEELFNHACFDFLKSRNPDTLRKVCLVNGDCQRPVLGLGAQDIEILCEETTCVIHAAANVRFDQSLKEATYNVKATRDLLEMVKQMPKLRVFVFVSTAFSNCIYTHIEEKFYEPPMQVDNLLAVVNILNDEILEAVTPELLGKWPNTYVFTKSVSEDLIRLAGDTLPVTIVRPAIVASTIAEPMPGWVDNFYGIIGVVAAVALGVIRSLHAKLDATAHVVPCDYVVNCVLAAAWKRAKSGTTTVYNFVGDKTNKLTWKDVMAKVEPCCWAAPTDKVVWYFCFKVRENPTWHKICIFFLHTLPAYIVDFIFLCLGRPRIAVKGYQRLNKVLDSLSFFSTKDWVFENDNVLGLWNEMSSEDRKLFCFNMEGINWDEWAYKAVFGGRQHLLKDTPDTLPKGQRKVKILFVAHYSLLAILWFLLYKFIMFLIRPFL